MDGTSATGGDAVNAAARVRELEAAIALHRRRRLGEADDIAFLAPEDIDAALWATLPAGEPQRESEESATG